MKKLDYLPKVFFSEQAFLKVVLEMQKFYKKGLELSGSAWEAVAYPLAFLKTRKSISPFEMISLRDIDKVIVSHVFYPDDEYKNYSSARANFLPGVNENMEKKISPILLKYPLLDFCCKLHSHPSGRASLSGGDKKFSILNSLNDYQERGLNTILSFVMTSKKYLWQEENSWKISAFALDNNRENIFLETEIIPHDSAIIQESREMPFYKLERNFLWMKKCLDFFAKNQTYQVEICELYRAWISWCFYLPDSELHICFSPNFPDSDIRVIAFGRFTEVLPSLRLNFLLKDFYYKDEVNTGLLEEILTLKSH